MKQVKIEMFNIYNNTNDFVVCVDGLFGFVTKEEASKLFALVDNIEESPFGSAQILPPFTGCKSGKTITDFKSVDIAKYITKNINKKKESFKFVNVVDAYKSAKESYDAWSFCSDFIKSPKEIKEEVMSFYFHN